jgi:hypothetical protein
MQATLTPTLLRMCVLFAEYASQPVRHLRSCDAHTAAGHIHTAAYVLSAFAEHASQPVRHLEDGAPEDPPHSTASQLPHQQQQQQQEASCTSWKAASVIVCSQLPGEQQQQQ